MPFRTTEARAGYPITLGTVQAAQAKTIQRYAHLSNEALLAAMNAGDGVMGTN